MDSIRRTRRAIEELEKVTHQPMSTTAAAELRNAIEKLQKELSVQEQKLKEDAKEELANIKHFVTNPIVIKMLSGFIEILNKQTVPANSALIRILMEGEDEQVQQAASASEEKSDTKDALPQAEARVWNAVGSVFYKIKSNIFREQVQTTEARDTSSSLTEAGTRKNTENTDERRELDRTQQSNSGVPEASSSCLVAGTSASLPQVQTVDDDPVGRKKESDSSSPAPIAEESQVLDLNIWSNEVDWNNDVNFVRIYLPIRAGITLTQVTVRMVHLELGHRLKVKYPGVNFSVLINHSSIEGKVEARIIATKLIIRITKSEKYLWTFINIVSASSSHLCFHLDAEHYFTTPKRSDLMTFIHENGKTTLIGEGLSHLEFPDLIKREFKIDPWPILKLIRISKYKLYLDESKYKEVCRCCCDTCRGVNAQLEKNRVHVCDVWWQNDLEHSTIYLENASKIPIQEVSVYHNNVRGRHKVRVRIRQKVSMIHFKHDLSGDPVKKNYEDGYVTIKLKKDKKCLWQHIKPLTIDQDQQWYTCHLNRYYHFKVKWSVVKVDQKKFGDCVDHYIDALKEYDLTRDEISEILTDSEVLHYVQDNWNS